MTFLEFLSRHFLQYSAVLEFLFITGTSTFFFKYLRKNKDFNFSLIANGIGIVIFVIWAVWIYIDYLALGNWGGSLGTAYLSIWFFMPAIIISLFGSVILLFIGIIKAANEKSKSQKRAILLLLCIIIIVLIGLFLYQYLPTRIEFTSWKTYTSNTRKFSIDYPSTWVYSWSSLDTYIFFYGDNGSISIDYGDGIKPFCDNGLEDMKVGNENFMLCVHDTPGVIERWFLSNKTNGINITAIAEKPIDRNKEIILKMLSTFKLTK